MNEERQNIDEERDAINDIFLKTEAPVLDDETELMSPAIIIDMDEIDRESKDTAEFITTRMANFWFSDEWVKAHPYIEPKICSEMDNIRRLNKMLRVNEIAQNSLVQNISCNAGKGALYSALTSLQIATINIQKQLDDKIKEMEDIFRKMQDECREAFSDKEKEQESDGTMTVRGSKDFIKELTQKLYGEKKTLINTETGEVLSSTTNYTIEEQNG